MTAAAGMAADLRRAGAALTNPDALVRACEQILAAELRRAVPHRTGNLARSVRVTAPGVVSATAPYARVIDQGWRRHGIEPRGYAAAAAAAATPDCLDAAGRYADRALDGVG